MANNKLIILVGKDGRPSMKGVYSKMNNKSNLLIRRQLQNPKGINEYWRWYENHNINEFKKLIGELNIGANIIVRWGNSIPLVEGQGFIMYNRASAISKASNKKLSREIFEENGLNCPKLIRFEADINTFPLIARPSKHAKGKNFVIIKDMNEYKTFIHMDADHNDWYVSEFVDKVQEFRLHIGHGKVKSATLLSN